MIHINVPLGHVFGTTGITVLFFQSLSAALLLSASTNHFSAEIVNCLQLSGHSHRIICTS
jgi:hypothetical protein